MKTVGAAGLGSVLGPRAMSGADEGTASESAGESEFPQMPKRVLGKTGVEVSALALGTIFDLVENQVVLRSCLKWGVTYWDTAHSYAGGNSELGIGRFLKANPDVRKKVFLVSKASGAGSAEEVEQRLQTSLERMKTDYIDLYYGVHVLNNISQLKDELKPWAEDAKKRGVIRHFGFSTHKNMAANLGAASKLGWVDAILTTYNFRLTQDAEMQRAVDACHKAGIGLTAMKTQGLKIESDEDKKLVEHFTKKGFTEGQTKIKAVLEDERFASAAVRMENVGLVTENVAAVLDKTKLSKEDRDVLAEYARETCDGYCAGCATICDAALGDMPYVSDVMRLLMYHNSYGDRDRARELFAELPGEVRQRLLSINYRPAEARCPQHIPIGRLMCEAVRKLA